jgi:phage terminase large subunit-like protein
MLDLVESLDKVEKKITRWLPPQIQTYQPVVIQSHDIVDWVESNFYIPELKAPIKLYPYQKATLREALAKDDNGKFKYNLIVWGDIKKSAKSSIAAARALFAAQQNQWGSVKIIANDIKQADSRVNFYLRRALELNPKMTKDVDYRQVGYKTLIPSLNSTIEAIPIDPGGEAGGNDDLIIFSELWDAKHKAMQLMWTEMTLSPTKFGYSQRWVETYAGYTGESPILERLYERGLSGERLDLSYSDSEGYHDLADLEVYQNSGMLMLWNSVPRLPFQTPEYYKEEEENLIPEEFERVHRNRWIGSVVKFVDKLWWNACLDSLPALDRSQPAILAADAAKGGDSTRPADCFALVLVTRHPSKPDTVATRYCGIWQAEKGKLLDFEPIENEIRRICQEFSIVEFTYDPYQLHDMAMRLKREVVVNVREFNQNKDRLMADKLLRDLIIGRRIAHDGNPLLSEHIDNANVVNHGEDGIRLVKRLPQMKIDSAVALSMAASRCLYFNLA